MRELLHKIKTWLSLDLTELEFRATTKWGKLAWRQARILLYVGKRLVLGRHNERAAALTYLSLLAIIPLLAVVFSLFKAFGGFSGLEGRAKDWLLEYIPDSSQQVSAWLSGFIESFNAGAVGFVGMGALLVTVILTLSNIENALNSTWSVRTPRGWGMRLVVYWMLLTVAPVLLGASIAVTATVQSHSAVTWLRDQVPGFTLLTRLVPLLSTSLAFTALYYVLPSARVSVGAAWTGGLVAAVLFEVAKWAYTLMTSRSVSANALYGSLAAFPAFVIWLNYSWRIVLFGADVVHATQYSSSDPTEETDPRTNQAAREEGAVRIVALVSAAFVQRQPPPTSRALAQHLMLPAHLVNVLCSHLLERGLLREERTGAGLMPSQPPEQLTMADVVYVMRHQVGVAHWPLSDDSNDTIDRLLLDSEKEALDKMRAVTWAQLAADLLQPAAANNLTVAKDARRFG